MIKVIAPSRGFDEQGSGKFGAARAGGRKHIGEDFACVPGSGILAVEAGMVTKIGYPYNPSSKSKGHLRYVQVTDKSGNDARYFYI